LSGTLEFGFNICEGGACAYGDFRGAGEGVAESYGFADAARCAGDQDMFSRKVGFERVDVRVGVVMLSGGEV
jgi:hypothetical protein